MIGDVAGSARPLRGESVLAIGLRYDTVALGCRVLARAGARVVVYDVYPTEEWREDDELEALDDAVASGAVEIVNTVAGADVAQVLSDEDRDGWAELWEDALQRLGGTRTVVYLGGWWGVVDYAVGQAAMAAVGRGDAHGVIATYQGDDRFRRMLRWAGDAGVAEQVTVLRQPPRERVTAGGLTETMTAVDVLLSAGWSGPLTVLDADAAAAHRRQAGHDLLAGVMWRFERSVWFSRGTVVVADASQVPDDWEPPERWWEARRTAGGIAWLDAPTPMLLVRGPYQDLAGDIDVTPENGPAEGIRVAFDADAFMYDRDYNQVDVIRLPSGRVLVDDIGSPQRFGRRIEIDAAPGTWAVELTTFDDEAGFRLRRLPE